jgi:hypothetical protein
MFQPATEKLPPHVQVLSMIHGAVVSQALLVRKGNEARWESSGR